MSPSASTIGRRAGAAVLAVAIVLVAVTALRSLGRDDDARDGASGPSGEAVALVPASEPRVASDGEQVLLTVPMTNRSTRAIRVTSARGPAGGALPFGIAPALPPAGVPIAVGATADLPLRWAGPDCAAPVPDQVLPELEVEVTVERAVVVSTVATSELDLTLRDAWRAACDDTPDDTPDDTADDRPDETPDAPPQDPAPQDPVPANR